MTIKELYQFALERGCTEHEVLIQVSTDAGELITENVDADSIGINDNQIIL